MRLSGIAEDLDCIVGFNNRLNIKYVLYLPQNKNSNQCSQYRIFLSMPLAQTLDINQLKAVIKMHNKAISCKLTVIKSLL